MTGTKDSRVTRESKIEKHLVDEVKRRGGLCRKVKWLGRRGAPDRFVALYGGCYFVELKAPKGVVSLAQKHEIALLNHHGVPTVVLSSIADVDAWIGHRNPGEQ